MHLPRKLPKPDLLPGCCSRCRAEANREFYIDVGFQTFDEPGIYLCNVCIDDIIKEDGRYIKKEVYDKDREKWKSDVDALLSQGSKYDTLIEHLGEIINGTAVNRNAGRTFNADEPAADRHNPETNTNPLAGIKLT